MQYLHSPVQLAGAIKCLLCKGIKPIPHPTSVLDITLNHLMEGLPS